jgi:hypothetical protein
VIVVPWAEARFAPQRSYRLYEQPISYVLEAVGRLRFPISYFELSPNARVLSLFKVWYGRVCRSVEWPPKQRAVPSIITKLAQKACATRRRRLSQQCIFLSFIIQWHQSLWISLTNPCLPRISAPRGTGETSMGLLLHEGPTTFYPHLTLSCIFVN